MSGGYAYGETEPTEICPYCSFPCCTADYVDIGVGMQQAGPFHCPDCGASQIGPNDDERDLTEEEKKTGWYQPGSEPGSSANVVRGKVVSHVAMKALYQKEFRDNPLWNDEAYVDDWYKRVRDSGKG